jgi:hypothetical protein
VVVDHGCAEALVGYLSSDPNNEPLNAIMVIGFIALFSLSLATGLINECVCGVVIKVFTDSEKDYVKAASTWTIGQIEKYSSEHALHLTNQNGLTLLLEAHLDRNASDDLRTKSKRALKLIIKKCTEVEALQPLIDRVPKMILQYVVEQIAKLFSENPQARVPFVTSWSFQSVQRIEAESRTNLREQIESINNCYPNQLIISAE